MFTSSAIQRMQQCIQDNNSDNTFDRCLRSLDEMEKVEILRWVRDNKNMWANDLVLRVAQSINPDHPSAREFYGLLFVHACVMAEAAEVAQWKTLVDENDDGYFNNYGMRAAVAHDRHETVQLFLSGSSWDKYPIEDIFSSVARSQSPSMLALVMDLAPDPDTKLACLYYVGLHGVRFHWDDPKMIELTTEICGMEEIHHMQRWIAVNEYHKNPDPAFVQARAQFFNTVEAVLTRKIIADELGDVGASLSKPLKL